MTFCYSNRWIGAGYSIGDSSGSGETQATHKKSLGERFVFAKEGEGVKLVEKEGIHCKKKNILTRSIGPGKERHLLTTKGKTFSLKALLLRALVKFFLHAQGGKSHAKSYLSPRPKSILINKNEIACLAGRGAR